MCDQNFVLLDINLISLFLNSLLFICTLVDFTTSTIKRIILSFLGTSPRVLCAPDKDGGTPNPLSSIVLFNFLSFCVPVFMLPSVANCA